ncbi:MAG: DegT/DnrJ/EryC1/StrS family aminotransferase [Blastochloris sp.]|nr:DegT/DnrJ/EryC1/StrS family aminotransferase [Blastochloris sp.]
MHPQVPYFSLSEQHQALKKDLLHAIEKTIDQNNFCLGPDVDAFETEFKPFSGTDFCVAMNSGTSALHIALLLHNIGPGDEVITTPFTFASTSWAISYVGAKPVYVDIEPNTYQIDPTKIEAAINSRTKAILPVHLYGHPCDMDAILAIADKHGLPVIEDAAQAHGAAYKGRIVGNLGRQSCFSFYPTKNLGACGEGGVLCTNQPDLARRAIALRNHGSYQRYHYEEVGYNYRMEGIQAAVLRVKLRHLNSWLEARRSHAEVYHQRLATLTSLGLILPQEQVWARSSWHLYVVRHPRRDALQQHLQDHGVGSAIHYPIPLHLQKCYEPLGYAPGSFPVAEQVARECLALPFYPEMTPTQIHRVCEVLQAYPA